MAIAIEAAADLIIIFAWAILIGLLIAITYTLVKMAEALNVSILGIHPFGFLARFLHNHLIRWCEAGIKDLEGVPAELLHGLAWQMDLLSRALHAIARATEHAFTHVHRDVIPGLIHAAVHPLRLLYNALDARVDALSARVTRLFRQAEADIHAAERTAIRTAENYADDLIGALRADVISRLSALEHTLEGELGLVAGELSAAERTIEAQIADIQNLIRSLGLTDIQAALAALATVVAVLEAETGLGNAECRSRVGNLCGINPSIWADLIAGLAFLDFSLSLRELAPLARTAVADLNGAVQALA